MHPGLTIGEFAALTHLSVRTLRRYHEGGLLEPAKVDPHSGYRYYSTSQIPTAQVIHRLRELDMPLQDVGAILQTADPDQRAVMISGHLRRLEVELERTRAAVNSLRRLLEPRPESLRVDLRSRPASTVAAVAGTVDSGDILDWYSSAMAELDAAMGDLEASGPPGGVYANELFTAGRGDMLVYVPVADPPHTGRVHRHTLPPAELATTVHVGDHSDIDVTYGLLGAYVADHALAVDGPVGEVYRVGPRDTSDSARWRTEISWPIFRISPAR